MAKIRERYAPERVLENWRNVIEALPHMNEDELQEALEEEVETKKRADVIRRLHARYTKVRQERELQEYLS